MRMDGYMDVERFVFRPGKVFAHFLMGPGRQTALLSAKALHYDPYRQVFEKRLTRYFSYQWRVRASSARYKQPYRVRTLLEAIGHTINLRLPARTRDRLEMALDRLTADQIIASWHYEHWNEEAASRHGWVTLWLDAIIQVEPPEEIRTAYQALERHESSRPARLPEPTRLGDRLRKRRRDLGLTQTEVAADLAIDRSYVGRIEAGRGQPSPDIRQRIEAWLARHA